MNRRPAHVLALAAACLLVGTACSDPGDVADDEEVIPTVTIPPTTQYQVLYMDVSGRSYCDVADEMASAVRVYADPAANLGDATDTEVAYVGALVAFDALAQVAGREITGQLELLRSTLETAVAAAAAADWDITQVSDDAESAEDVAEVASALAVLRRYTLERCNLDLVEPEPPVTAAPTETPEQRRARVAEDTFPELSDESLACVIAFLPLDFDPDAADFDPAVVVRAFARCGIDPNQPSAPTTIRGEDDTETDPSPASDTGEA